MNPRTKEDFLELVAKTLEANRKELSLYFDNFVNKLNQDEDENFIWEDTSDNIKHTFIIINNKKQEIDADTILIGITLEHLEDIQKSAIGNLSINLLKEELSLTIDVDDMYYNDEVIKDYILGLLGALDKMFVELNVERPESE